MNQVYFDENMYTYVDDKCSFKYYLCENHDGNAEIAIAGYEGKNATISVPCDIVHNGVAIPVTGILKKTFLGNKYVHEIVIPGSIRNIGDWAMAQCRVLDTVVIHQNYSQNDSFALAFGRGVFQDCNSIKHICIGNGEKNTMSALLAAVPTRLKADYLLNAINFTEDGWIKKWDLCLLDFLQTEDYNEANYMSWGEEDSMQNRKDVRAHSIINKVSLCMLRLMNKDNLEYPLELVIKEYLLGHNIGCESEETWNYITGYHGNEIEYYKVLADIGGINKNNVYKMLESLKDEFTEAKAYIIKYNHDTP